MDLEFGEKYEDFRSEVRSFLKEHKPDFGKNAGLSRDRRGPLIGGPFRAGSPALCCLCPAIAMELGAGLRQKGAQEGFLTMPVFRSVPPIPAPCRPGGR